jgi:hypothetical protein
LHYNINNITKQEFDIEYMNWTGRAGYMVQLFFYKDVLVSHQLESLYIPKDLLEFDDFKSTLKRLLNWKPHKTLVGNNVRLAAFEETQRYLSADVATSHDFNYSSPRSPRPMITPSRVGTKNPNFIPL